MYPPVDVLLQRLKGVAKGLFLMRDYDPIVLRKKIPAPHHTDPNNQAYLPDIKMQIDAELCIRSLSAEYNCDTLVLGEETGEYPESLAGETRSVAVVDAVDGTDLMVRGLSNYCLSFAFFDPAQQKIHLSVVAHSSGILYYATDAGAFQENAAGVTRKLQVNTNGVRLKDSSICFYGQKPRFLMGVLRRRHFIGRIREFERRMESGEKLDVRLYNLAGNPMMAKIPDGAVDLVFEVSGQEVHDIIPGAFIAVKAGARLVGLDGQPIDLAKSLLSPRKKLTYILASSQALIDEMLPLLK